MLQSDAEQPAAFCDGLTRRAFLHTGALAAAGLTLPDLRAPGKVRTPKATRCIVLFLVGGPSHLDTFDMKPDAPMEVRGPYKPIKTAAPCMQIAEFLPRLARHARDFAIVRTLHHEAACVHDTGHQMMQTGWLFDNGVEHPHIGCVLDYLRDRRQPMPSHVLLPYRIGNTGGNLPHGQSAGFLGEAYDPFVFTAPSNTNAHGRLAKTAHTLPAAAREAFDLAREPEAVVRAYGLSTVGQSCLRARRLVERGVSFVTVNMFETVFNQTTWDIHGAAPFSSIECYGDQVGPMFDFALSALLEDLKQRGLLETTLVVAMGEFGRTPKLNSAGGRDHWPHAWSILMAGGGIEGGRVVGKTDAIGAFPVERPVTPAEVVATMYYCLGIDLQRQLAADNGRRLPLLPPGTTPIAELV
jgi:uncharacterized protein (DUF1501 family)